MLSSLRLSSDEAPDFVASVADLLESTSRLLFLTVGGIYLFWTLTVTVFLFQQPVGAMAWRILPVLLIATPLAIWLLPRSLIAAHVVWQLGLAITITLAIYIFEQPEIAFFYALLSLMATVSVSWRAGLVVEGGIVVLLWWLSGGPLKDLLPGGYVYAVIIASLVTLALGWIVTHALFTVIHWMLYSLAKAREHLKETNRHRAELVQAQKNMERAQYQLDRANASLVAAWRAADEAARFKTEFVNNVSHELRTPLNLIAGFSEMMMTSPESYGGVVLPRVYRGDMNSIYHSAQHLLALVDDILDLGRIEAGKITLIREELNLNEVINEAVDMVRDYIAAKGLELRIQIAPDLPNICADHLRIRQVLLNLLVNASRFTKQGYVKVVAELQGAEVVVRVRDTGKGIPEQDLPKIFEEFRTTNQPLSTWHSGTGLGLPISKKFVELHCGRMWAESTVGKGTTMWFTLPCKSRTDIEEEVPEETRSLPPVRIGSTEPIAVVVHQDSKVALALQRYLDGYHVMWADSVATGLSLADEVKAVAVITEYISTNGEMGDPALLLSRNDCLLINCPLPSERWATLMLGVEEFLTKPVLRETLLAAIDRIKTEIQTVLIADDNPEVVELFERMLISHPTVERCLHAYNGEEALQLATMEQPDLVLLDMVMPGLDGHAVLDYMGTDPALIDIPVIAVSAEPQSQIGLQAAGPIQIFKAGNFSVMGEITSALEAIFNALAPQWRQLDATVSRSAAEPPGLPA